MGNGNKRQTDIIYRGVESIIRGISERLPDLSEEESEELTDSLLDEVGKRIRAGEDIAFIKRTLDGKAHIQHVDLSRIRRR